MVVHAVSTPLPYAHYQRCPQCDMRFPFTGAQTQPKRLVSTL
jgi:uncharacterized paraquat-inducible protein A